MSVLDDSGREFRVDLANCDREPIHVPGHVQPFGSLFALDPESLRILQVSENVRERFGIAAEKLVSQSIDAFLDPAQVRAIETAQTTEDIVGNPVLAFSGEVRGRGPFNLVLHSFQGLLILELEDCRAGEPVVDYHSLVKRTLRRLEATETLSDLCQRLAEEARAISGFDRVMVYRFLEDASGTVVGESLAEGMDAFIGLHYPASDIPAQARQLFLLNSTRLIADSSYSPSPVTPPVNPLTGKPLDMSFAVLRGVSPIHCQYLRNMGVVASMSQAIVVDGKLWGLLSSHACAARPAPYSVRAALEFLAKSASLLIRAKMLQENAAYVRRAEELHDALVASMAAHPTIIEGLTGAAQGIETYVNAGGCAIFADGEVYLAGATPSRSEVVKLVAWLKGNVSDEVFATNSLVQDYPEAFRIKDSASGVLAIRLTRVPGEYVLWFRPEVIQTVNWAGNPEKPVEETPQGRQLTPRKSFELWQQEVQNTAVPWHSDEINGARRLRIAITEVVLKRAEEVSRTNVRLERSNVELDSFAYIASHDLKEPLRGISNYSTFLLEDYGEQLDAPGRDRLEALVRLSERMESLTDSLLHYSRLGRQDLEIREVDMNDVLQESLDAVSARLEETGTQVRIPWPLPTMRCDPVQFVEVFQNLLSNAAKYNDKPEKWVEIGMLRGRNTLPNEQSHVLYVRDNGIGIAPKHQESVFRIFKRLHGRNEYGGGSGAGLTIAQKIVQRHGGRLWLESAPGEGTTFFFTLGV